MKWRKHLEMNEMIDMKWKKYQMKRSTSKWNVNERRLMELIHGSTRQTRAYRKRNKIDKIMEK